MNDRKKVIIDTDCGSDDAMAIAMALNEPSIEILFFTTVHGNVPARQAAKNTLTTIELSNTYEPPVYLGCESPLMRDSVFAFEVHGQDGLGDLGYVPKRLKLAEENAVFKMVDALNKAGDKEIEIITLGPLTNIAAAMKIDENAMKKVKRISMMGSSGLGWGNVTPIAEFNIWQDGEAAKIVVDFATKHHVPLLFVGWDACLGDAMLQEEDINKIHDGSALGEFAIDCNRALADMNVKRFGKPVLDMADPAAMAAILYPECVKECGDYYCDVDVSNGISYGALLVDRTREFGAEPNAAVCSELHGDKFKEYLYRTLCTDYFSQN